MIVMIFLTFFYRSSVWPSGNVWDAESYYNVWYKHVPLPAPSTPGLQALCGVQWQVLGIPLWCELLWGLQGMINDCLHNLVHIYWDSCFLMLLKNSVRFFFNVLAMIFWVKIPFFSAWMSKARYFWKVCLN